MRQARRDKLVKMRWISILTMLAVLPLLGGCESDENHEFIQGYWYHPDFGKRGTEQFIGPVYWAFENGNYTFWQCCAHVEDDTGKYQVVKSEGDVIILELLDRTGRPRERGQIKLIVNREDDTLVIQRGEPFVRGGPLR